MGLVWEKEEGEGLARKGKLSPDPSDDLRGGGEKSRLTQTRALKGVSLGLARVV